MLRLEANGLQLLESSLLQSPISEELMEMSALSADFFDQEAIASLAEAQYKSLPESYQVTQHLSALNLGRVIN
ncbi:MAG: hypothetical protein ACHBN1_18985 [Heteroscytonema crispum UTEX LB 1556]